MAERKPPPGSGSEGGERPARARRLWPWIVLLVALVWSIAAMVWPLARAMGCFVAAGALVVAVVMSSRRRRRARLRAPVPAPVTAAALTGAPDTPPGAAPFADAGPHAVFARAMRLLDEGREDEAVTCFLEAYRTGPPELRRLVLTELDELGQVEPF